MKTIQLTIALAALFAGNVAATATEQDTVKIIDNPHRVVITEDSTGSHIQILGEEQNKGFAYNYDVSHSPDANVRVEQKKHDWDLRFPFQKKEFSGTCFSHWSIVLNGIYGGFGWAHVEDGYTMLQDNIGHEYEWGILNLVGLEYSTGHGQVLSLGFGLESRRYHMHNIELQFFKNDEAKIDVTHFPELARHRNSDLNLFTLQFPLMFRQGVGDFTFCVAGIMDVNTGGNLVNKYRLDEIDYKVKTRHIGQRKVSFDVMGAVSYKGLGLYVRYRPQSILEADAGAKISTLSAGIILGF